MTTEGDHSGDLVHCAKCGCANFEIHRDVTAYRVRCMNCLDPYLQVKWGGPMDEKGPGLALEVFQWQ